MEKKASTLRNMVVSLLCVTVLSGSCVGGMYLLTRSKIALAEQEKQQAAIKAVLPDFDRLEARQIEMPDGNGTLTAYTAYAQDVPVGTAIQTFTKKGFAGEIRLMAGVLPDGTLYRVQVLQHAETPGLGSKMTDAKFAGQFENRHPDTFKLRVKKDGGDVDAITAATISSRAYCDALERAFNTLASEGGCHE